MFSIRKSKVSALIVLFLINQFMIFIATPILVTYFFDDMSGLGELFAQIISFGIPLLAILLLSSSQNRDGSYTMLFELRQYNKRVTSYDALLAIVFGVLLSLIVQYFFSIIEASYILMYKDYLIINTLPKLKPIDIIIGILTLIIFPSILEEILYRGMYYDTLKSHPPVFQYIIPTMIFAFSHRGIFSALSASILSIMLILLMRKKESIVFGVIVHLAYNTITFVSSNLFSLPFSVLRLLNNYANSSMFYGAIFIYIGVIILLVYLLRYVYRKISIAHEHDESISNSDLDQTSDRKLIYWSLILICLLNLLVFVLRLTLS